MVLAAIDLTARCHRGCAGGTAPASRAKDWRCVLPLLKNGRGIVIDVKARLDWGRCWRALSLGNCERAPQAAIGRRATAQHFFRRRAKFNRISHH
jgi:hypothetical protein